MAVYLLALGAAMLFGLGSVIQQRVASVAPPGRSLRPSLLLWLVRQPKWLAGLGTAVVGNVLSGAALGMGSVALVQPLLVARLLFALPLSAVWVRQHLTLRDWLGMLATAGGLGVFIAVGRPHEAAQANPQWWQWLLLVAVVLTLTLTLVFSARKLSPAREAPMLGAGAGMMFALQSGFTHTAVGGLTQNGVTGLLLNWTTYAVAVCAIGGTLLAQSAYEMAPLAASYPALAAVEPLTGIGIGVGILGTTLAFGLWHLAVFVFALAVMTLGIYFLATSTLVSGQRETMATRRTEEIIADLEREIDDELCHLDAAVSWLERCRTPDAKTPRESAVTSHVQRVRHRLETADAALRRLDEQNTGAEEELEESIESDGRPDRLSEEERALARYHEENRAREKELRARTRELRERAQTQLAEPVPGR